MGFDDGSEFVRALLNVPKKVERILGDRSSIQKVAEKYANYDDMLFLGRKSMFPIALEGALKLKEISYIHAEGYPAAEMKHGPIALVSSKCHQDILMKRIQFDLSQSAQSAKRQCSASMMALSFAAAFSTSSLTMR